MAAPMPKKLVDRLKKDPFMQQCCVCGKTPQWHHHFEYARKALNVWWAILPLCAQHHDMARFTQFRRLLDWAMLNRAPDEELEKYSRVMDYKGRRGYLNTVFGKFSPRKMREHYETNRHLEKI